MEAKGAAERKAATEALQAARAAAEQVRPGVGAETTGTVQVRRAEERCKEAERATKLWETRRWQTRYVAGTLRNSRGAAGPGASLPRCPVLQPTMSSRDLGSHSHFRYKCTRPGRT